MRSNNRTKDTATLTLLREFFQLESAAGILLIGAAIIALILANSEFALFYHTLLSWKLGFALNDWGMEKSLLHWINDGLMAIFFLLVGLEIKREILEGELSTRSQAFLPLFAAAGGIMCPALIYTFLNAGDAIAMRGWAVPTATDIAFSLGVLALFGSRIPISLKIFLMAVAVIDDLAAIIIIAVFYTEALSLPSLLIALACLSALILLNTVKVRHLSVYVLVGFILWIAVLESGVHATIAGVLLGLCIPLNTKDEQGRSLLRIMEQRLHPYVAFLILPIFSFANAGVSFKGMNPEFLFQPIVMGIALGLFLGKQIGIFTVVGLLVKLRLVHLPQRSNWLQLYAVSMIAGIGFTMSLFIGSLAFRGPEMGAALRLGVLSGSLLSVITGAVLLSYTCWRKSPG